MFLTMKNTYAATVGLEDIGQKVGGRVGWKELRIRHLLSKILGILPLNNQRGFQLQQLSGTKA